MTRQPIWVKAFLVALAEPENRGSVTRAAICAQVSRRNVYSYMERSVSFSSAVVATIRQLEDARAAQARRVAS